MSIRSNANNNQNNDFYSIKSSALNSVMLEQKRKNEAYAYILGALSQFIWSVNSIHLKSFEPLFPQTYSSNSLVFWRSVPIWLLGAFFAKQKGLKIVSIKDIKYKFWFFIRSLGNYLSVWLWIKVLSYFRVSTCQVISGCNPILVIGISIVYLKETFYFRYVICLILCIIGSALIVLNERNPETKQSKINDNILVGLFFAISNLVMNALSGVAQKIMVKENIYPDVQNYYLGLYNAIPAFIFCIFEFHFGITDIKYVLYALSNGAFLFYLGNFLQTKALEYIAVSKFVPVTYLQTVFVFILGVTLCGESLFITDILGASLIIGFQLYNFYYPPHSERRKKDKVNDTKTEYMIEGDNENHIWNNNENNDINQNNSRNDVVKKTYNNTNENKKYLEPIEEHIIEH